MIREIHIENFKSIEKLTIELGGINVFIGENGCGKSNILEAIAFATAASRTMLDNEFLVSRGIRTTEPKFMRSAFRENKLEQNVQISWKADNQQDFACVLRSDESSTHQKWVDMLFMAKLARFVELFSKLPKDQFDAFQKELEPLELSASKDKAKEIQRILHSVGFKIPIVVNSPDFLIYAPENTALRNFQAEGQILPLGSKGEGLFAHLRELSNEKNRSLFNEIVENLSLVDWFERFDIPTGLSPGERTIHIRDRYLAEGALIDQRSANEGFLFLLFYFTLFISPHTPSFFAVDNVDASLNPKLCAELIKHLARLAQMHGKQAIFTTHNPAVLDGLNLHDREQRLFVIHRTSRGPTKARRVHPPKPIDGQLPMKLSAAFLAGHIGGLPKNF